MSDESNRLRELVATVAAAYFSNSHVSASDIPGVISQIAGSLSNVGAAATDTAAEPVAEAAAPRATRAQISRSITPDALVSFEDGKRYKTLRRHLSTRGLSPEQYREKWGLPRDYPMVAPSYSAARSQMAKSLGLGRKGAEARAKPARGRARAPKA